MIDVTVDNGYGSRVIISGDSANGFCISLRHILGDGEEASTEFLEGYDRDDMRDLVKAILTILAMDEVKA